MHIFCLPSLLLPVLSIHPKKYLGSATTVSAFKHNLWQSSLNSFICYIIKIKHVKHFCKTSLQTCRSRCHGTALPAPLIPFDTWIFSILISPSCTIFQCKRENDLHFDNSSNWTIVYCFSSLVPKGAYFFKLWSSNLQYNSKIMLLLVCISSDSWIKSVSVPKCFLDSRYSQQIPVLHQVLLYKMHVILHLVFVVKYCHCFGIYWPAYVSHILFKQTYGHQWRDK